MYIIGGRVTDTADSRVKFRYCGVLVGGVIHTTSVRVGNLLKVFLGAFAKLLRRVCAVRSFVLSQGATRLPLDGFS